VLRLHIPGGESLVGDLLLDVGGVGLRLSGGRREGGKEEEMAEEESSLATKADGSHTKAGLPNFTQQCKALFRKNFLLSRRNLRATGNLTSLVSCLLSRIQSAPMQPLPLPLPCAVSHCFGYLLKPLLPFATAFSLSLERWMDGWSSMFEFVPNRTV
jgi:hypothetical protein